VIVTGLIAGCNLSLERPACFDSGMYAAIENGQAPHLYRFETVETQPWQRAEQFCEAEGGHLATPDTFDLAPAAGPSGRSATWRAGRGS